jgi:hypothetical protein
MSFRNIKNKLPIEHVRTSFVTIHDDKFVDVNLNVPLPSSNDYCLSDLLASGQRVVPVDTTIIHDSAATSQLVSNIVNIDDNKQVINNSNDK